MKLKQYENLSLYGISENFKVVDLKNKEVVKMTKNQYLLVTDEILLGVNIKRRFTIDQIKSMYAKGIPIDPEQEKLLKESNRKNNESNIKTQIAPNGLLYPYYVINGEAYQSSREAAKVYITMSYSTIRRKCKRNADGWFEITGK